MTPSEPRRHLHDTRALRAEHDLGIGRTVLDPERLHGPPREPLGRPDAALSRPDVGEGDAEGGGGAVTRSVTVSAWKRPSIENAFTVTSWP